MNPTVAPDAADRTMTLEVPLSEGFDGQGVESGRRHVSLNGMRFRVLHAVALAGALLVTVSTAGCSGEHVQAQEGAKGDGEPNPVEVDPEARPATQVAAKPEGKVVPASFKTTGGAGEVPQPKGELVEGEIDIDELIETVLGYSLEPLKKRMDEADAAAGEALKRGAPDEEVDRLFDESLAAADAFNKAEREGLETLERRIDLVLAIDKADQELKASKLRLEASKAKLEASKAELAEAQAALNAEIAKLYSAIGLDTKLVVVR